MMRYALTTLALMLLLSGCNGIHFSTNAGEVVINKAARAVNSSNVDIYTDNEIFSYNAKFIGNVSTDACINERDKPLPRKDQLNRSLKIKVAQLGGNGLVIDNCKPQLDYLGCKRYVECKGRAFNIENSTQ